MRRSDAMTLIEDEVLLTLPFAPRCERVTCAGAPLAAQDWRRRGRPRSPRWQLEGWRRKKGDTLNARRNDAHGMNHR